MQEYGKSFYDDIVKTSEQMHVVSGDPMIVVERSNYDLEKNEKLFPYFLMAFASSTRQALTV